MRISTLNIYCSLQRYFRISKHLVFYSTIFLITHMRWWCCINKQSRELNLFVLFICGKQKLYATESLLLVATWKAIL